MEKEEILAKAQAEKIDEREIFINDKSMLWTYLVMAVSAGIFTIIRSFQELPIMDLCATVCLSASAGQFYRFIKTKERFNIVVSVIMFVIGITAAVLFFMGK